MRTKTFAILILLALSGITAYPVYAAKWHTVASQDGERIQIDKARIARVGEGQTMAWSRLILNRELAVGGKHYTSIEALNRYDCSQRRFTTVKRIYLQGVEPVQEERVSTPRQMSIDTGSVDEKLLVEACKLRTVGEMHQVAERASQAAATANPLPDEQQPARVILADVRQLAETRQEAQEKAARIRQVSGTTAEAPIRIGLPSRSELATRAAAEKAALMPDAPAAAPPPPAAAAPATPAAPAAPVAPAAHATAQPPLAPALTPTRPLYREISRGAPRRKAAVVEVRTPAVENHIVHWAYDGEGAPANWSKLRGDYATCASGKRQSPIDIRDSIHVDLEPIKFDYKPSMFRIVDNGHTVQANVGEGSSLTVMGRQFDLVQVHFHRPSEERVNGKVYEMVAHLVHKDLEGHLAVVAVLLEKGSEHPLIQTLWNNLPLEVGQELVPSVAIDLNNLLPENRAYWTYMGSLTTPPCSEGVLWMVMKQPVQVSPEQIAIFSRLYRNNARPVQPANNRLVKDTR